jgi:hypothetical protein
MIYDYREILIMLQSLLFLALVGIILGTGDW